MKLNLPSGVLLCTLDVSNLNTDIYHKEGIAAIKEMLAINRSPYDLPQSNYKVGLLQVVLIYSHFDFNWEYYHQISGTARSTKLVASYANMFMSMFEEPDMYTYPSQPTLCKNIY